MVNDPKQHQSTPPGKVNPANPNPVAHPSPVKSDVNHPAGAYSVNPRHSAGKPAQAKDLTDEQKAHLASLHTSTGGLPRPKDFKGLNVSEGKSRLDAMNTPELNPMGAYDHLIGELWPGAFGWLPLDADGVPSGPATLEPPEGPDVPVCRVFASVMPNFNVDLLVSAAGAPLVPPLNPNSDYRTHLMEINPGFRGQSTAEQKAQAYKDNAGKTEFVPPRAGAVEKAEGAARG